jgi:hypothetical protein
LRRPSDRSARCSNTSRQRSATVYGRRARREPDA